MDSNIFQIVWTNVILIKIECVIPCKVEPSDLNGTYPFFFIAFCGEHESNLNLIDLIFFDGLVMTELRGFGDGELGTGDGETDFGEITDVGDVADVGEITDVGEIGDCGQNGVPAFFGLGDNDLRTTSYAYKL